MKWWESITIVKPVRKNDKGVKGVSGGVLNTVNWFNLQKKK